MFKQNDVLKLIDEYNAIVLSSYSSYFKPVNTVMSFSAFNDNKIYKSFEKLIMFLKKKKVNQTMYLTSVIKYYISIIQNQIKKGKYKYGKNKSIKKLYPSVVCSKKAIDRYMIGEKEKVIRTFPVLSNKELEDYLELIKKRIVLGWNNNKKSVMIINSPQFKKWIKENITDIIKFNEINKIM